MSLTLFSLNTIKANCKLAMRFSKFVIWVNDDVLAKYSGHTKIASWPVRGVLFESAGSMKRYTKGTSFILLSLEKS